jgi:hypothetical protein
VFRRPYGGALLPDTPRRSAVDRRAETCGKVCKKCFDGDKARRLAIEKSAASLGDRSNAVKPAPRAAKPAEADSLRLSALPVGGDGDAAEHGPRATTRAASASATSSSTSSASAASASAASASASASAADARAGDAGAGSAAAEAARARDAHRRLSDAQAIASAAAALAEQQAAKAAAAGDEKAAAAATAAAARADAAEQARAIDEAAAAAEQVRGRRRE